MSDFSGDDSFECDSDLETEDEDVVAEALFYDANDDESVSPTSEQQSDAKSAVGEAKMDNEEQDLV